MNSLITNNNSRVAATATAIAALAVVAIGMSGADAFDSRSGSFDTAPSLSCPSSERVVLPHVAADQILDAALTPTQVANLYVAQTAGWTNAHINQIATTERPVLGAKPAQTEVDIRDMGMRRIGVFVVTQSDTGWMLTRTFECAAPKAAS